MRARPVAALVAVAAAAALAVQGAAAAPQARALTVYAKASRAQFVNHADDRERGDIKNPFQADDLPTPPSANSAKKGARAGDKAVISLKVYSDAALKRYLGTAVYTCTFTFAQVAICNADFQLGSGSMLASGPTKLDGSTIVLPVTTGTGRYAGARGQMTSTSVGGKLGKEIIRFELV